MTLAAEESERIRGSIDIPQDIQGTYWAMIDVNEVKPNGEGMVLLESIGIPVLVSTHNAKREGYINDFRINTDEGQTEFKITFANEGSEIIDLGKIEKGKCWVRLVNEKGERVKKIEFPDFFVFPNHEKKVRTRTKLDLPAGTYMPLAIIDYGGEQLVGAQGQKFKIPPQAEK